MEQGVSRNGVDLEETGETITSREGDGGLHLERAAVAGCRLWKDREGEKNGGWDFGGGGEGHQLLLATLLDGHDGVIQGLGTAPDHFDLRGGEEWERRGVGVGGRGSGPEETGRTRPRPESCCGTLLRHVLRRHGMNR